QEAGKFPESSHETGPLSNENDIAVTISSRFQFAAVFCGGLFSDSLDQAGPKIPGQVKVLDSRVATTRSGIKGMQSRGNDGTRKLGAGKNNFDRLVIFRHRLPGSDHPIAQAANLFARKSSNSSIGNGRLKR
ncbi:MAG: hypothetical protein K9J42_11095, partial [Sulfuritalea sp.]|nr:hypothetical protein [Sulfuritalea sp.]